MILAGGGLSAGGDGVRRPPEHPTQHTTARTVTLCPKPAPPTHGVLDGFRGGQAEPLCLFAPRIALGTTKATEVPTEACKSKLPRPWCGEAEHLDGLNIDDLGPGPRRTMRLYFSDRRVSRPDFGRIT